MSVWSGVLGWRAGVEHSAGDSAWLLNARRRPRLSHTVYPGWQILMVVSVGRLQNVPLSHTTDMKYLRTLVGVWYLHSC